MSRAVAIASVLILGPVSVTSAEPTGNDVLFEWNAIMVATASTRNPAEQGRVGAIAQVAVFEAVNAITGEHVPYTGTVIAASGASPEAAIVAAAHRVLTTYVPERAEALDAARTTSLAALPDGPGKDAGVAVGEAAAAALIALRENDGSQPPESYLPTSADPGAWQLTPACPPSGGVSLHWRNLRPFAIPSGDRFRPDAPPELSSWRYRRDLVEVKLLGATDSPYRPPDRTDVARVYAVLLATPLWNAVAAQIAAPQGRSLAENARALALLNVAINDATIAAFDAKYHYTFWRPETAIAARAAGDDASPTGEHASPFVPLIASPCHPSYPSAHASLGGAAREVLRRIYGDGDHDITVAVEAVPNVTLRYRRLGQITHDIDDARVYGGIHFRFDQQVGAFMGHKLGAHIYRHVLRRVHDHEIDTETEMSH